MLTTEKHCRPNANAVQQYSNVTTAPDVCPFMPDTQKRGMLNIKKVKGSPYSIIAKFHYMDPTGPDGTGPDQTKSAHFVWF